MMNEEIYALVGGEGNVINIIVWDGVSEYDPPFGCTVVKSDGVSCQIGGTYKDGVFTPAPQPQLTQDELLVQANSTKAGLMDESSQKISVLQDAVDLDMATDEEKTQLTAWKIYRVLLNRVDLSTAPDITWPAKPF